MSKKVFLNAGHGGSDPGAVGINGIKEKDVNLTVALACRDELKRHGVTVYMGRSTDADRTSSQIIEVANSCGASLAVDIHANAGKGDGAEVFYYSGGGESKELAKAILGEIVKLGQNSRGIKTKVDGNGKDYYYFIRETSMPAVLVETAFLDSSDVKIIDTTAEQKKFGVAIAKGILKQLGIAYKAPATTKPAATTNTTNTIYRVQVGAFSKKENAEAMKKKLKAAGFDAIIV